MVWYLCGQANTIHKHLETRENRAYTWRKQTADARDYFYSRMMVSVQTKSNGI
jgi:hypothetical protein